jgi:hypothetical protein
LASLRNSRSSADFPNWFHDFVGHTLAEVPKAPEFSWIPLLTSIVVALGGLAAGYYTYRNVKSAEEDKLQIPVLKNKWYFDELYEVVFIKPVTWFSEVFVSKWMDQGAIDGILHAFGPSTGGIGSFIRDKFDVPFINRFLGDGSADATWWVGRICAPSKRDAFSSTSSFHFSSSLLWADCSTSSYWHRSTRWIFSILISLA